MVGGLIAYGASHYKGDLMYPWQLLFMVLGIATVVWGCFIGWWLPDSPMKAKCFNEDEKRLMIERVRANETGIQNKVWKREQFVEALTDPVVWCYVMLQVTSTLIIGGLGVFSNLIIKSFGFPALTVQLLNIAQGAVTIMVMVGGAWAATASRQTAMIMHLWTVYVTISKGSPDGNGMLLTPLQASDHWYSGHLLDSSHSGNPCRTPDRVLLHSILLGRGQPYLLFDLAQHRRSDQEVDYPCPDVRFLGCRKHGSTPNLSEERCTSVPQGVHRALLSLRAL